MGEPDPPMSPPVLEFAAREVLKGTLVPLGHRAQLPEANALITYGAVRQLALTPGETDAVHRSLARTEQGDHPLSDATVQALRAFEQPAIPALQPQMSSVAAVPPAELTRFMQALINLRAHPDDAHLVASAGVREVSRASLNSAVVAARAFAVNTATQPLGMLNLERIEMVPVGIQRGELIATIPLAPGEETTVTHKEWSVTSKEFTSIVTDALEQTSETGVTDNTDLSQSTTSQNQHSVQFNITGTVQGGIPIINGSTTAGVTAQDANSNSATDSIKHATSLTSKASSRSRQEHKTTISTTTVTGTAETSTRVLKNTSATNPIRIDYFSLMRTWRVRLYRFGLRLTYDMVIPEPAASMRRVYQELENLKSQVGPFVFSVKHSDLTNEPVNRNTGKPPVPGDQTIPKYQWFTDQVQVSVPPYPVDPSSMSASATADGAQEWVKVQLEFDVPPGAVIKQIFMDLNINQDPHGGGMIFHMLGSQFWPIQLRDVDGVIITVHQPLFDGPGSSKPFLAGRAGHQNIFCLINDGERIIIQLTVELENPSNAVEIWRDDAWDRLYAAAQTQYYMSQQDIAARIAAIEEKLNSVDTLTLRREESEEVMKSVLRFVLGTDFDYMPAEVREAFRAAGVDLAHGVGFDGPTLGLSKDQWTAMSLHEDKVRFINQAIEWENVVTFLYSYFWDLPESWPFIRELRHPDATRQAFLRAGSARVVLTVRRGWEDLWLKFVQHGTIDLPSVRPTTGPYLTIAQEIAAYDDRNYPGIPPANPARSAVRLQDAVYTTSADTLAAGPGPVSITVASTADFVVGLPVVIDVEDSSHAQEAVPLLEVTDATHLVVAALTYPHDGAAVPFPVLQPGDKGALIAEWFEYTPSSGTDIAVTSNLATIA